MERDKFSKQKHIALVAVHILERFSSRKSETAGLKFPVLRRKVNSLQDTCAPASYATLNKDEDT